MSIHRTRRSAAAIPRLAALSAAMLTVPTGSVLAAAESGFTTVERMAMASNLGNYVLIRASSAPVSTGCTTDATWHFALDISNDWGRGAYAILMEARATGRRIYLSGTGVCSSGIETVRAITAYD